MRVGVSVPLQVHGVFVRYRGMKRRYLQMIIIGVSLLFSGGTGVADSGKSSAYPHSLEDEIKSLNAAGADESTDPVFLLRLAQLHLDAGDDLYTKKAKKRQAYEEGARIAKKALDLQEDNGRAHYLYAANLGNAAHLEGVMASAFTVGTLKKHIRRAIELEPDHAPALHMQAMLLERLPGLLGGDEEEALQFFKQTLKVDPNYTHARLNLAKGYIEREQPDLAKKELQTILTTKQPRNPYAYRQHQTETKNLLKTLEK